MWESSRDYGVLDDERGSIWYRVALVYRVVQNLPGRDLQDRACVCGIGQDQREKDTAILPFPDRGFLCLGGYTA